MTDNETQFNNPHMDESEEIITPSTLVRLGILGGLLTLSIFVFSPEIPYGENPANVISSENVSKTISPFEHIGLEATAAYVYDTTTHEVLFAKNESAQLPLASLTKVMTALVASERISEDTPITLTKEALATEGDSGLKAGEQWSFSDLLEYTLVVSSNDGAHAIAGVAGAFGQATVSLGAATNPYANFVADMNNKAHELGLTQTYFINESGLDTSTEVSGGYGSAKDMTTLLSFIISNRPHLLEATTFNTLSFVSKDGFIHNATNTNEIIEDIPGALASKTGYTDLAGGNLMMAFDAGINHPIVAVVLGSSLEGRFTDMKTLVEATLTDMSR